MRRGFVEAAKLAPRDPVPPERRARRALPSPQRASRKAARAATSCSRTSATKAVSRSGSDEEDNSDLVICFLEPERLAAMIEEAGTHQRCPAERDAGSEFYLFDPDS